MGDMADDALEKVENDWCGYLDYTHGDMDDAAAYDLGIVDENGNIPRSISYKVCKHCGQGGLLWGRHNDRWRLFDNGAIHMCDGWILNHMGQSS